MVSIGNVWDRTTEFLGEDLRQVLTTAILAILVPASISASLTGVGETGTPMVRGGIAVLGVVLSLVSLWGQLAITSLATDGSGARRATQRFAPAVGIYLLVLVVLGGIVLAAAFIALLLAGVDVSQVSWDAQSPNIPQMGVGLSAALLLLLVVAMLVLVRFAPLTAVIVAERRGLGAIPRAFRLTRGIWWKLVGIVLLYAVVSIVAQWAATAVFGSVLELVAGGEGPLSLAKVVTSVITAAVQTVFTVLAAAFTAKLYLACVAREERLGTPAAVPLS